MLAALLFVVASPQTDAKQVLQDIQAAYRKLDSLSVTIEHHDSSGLYPGDYTQELKWKKGGRFELKVTKLNPKDVASPGSKAPDYFCDGKDVLTIRPDGSRSSRPVNTDPNISPGYEVSGGLIMTILLDSPSGKVIMNPPAALGMTWSLGEEVEWKGEKGKQLILSIERQGQKANGTFYYAEGPLKLLGMEFKADKQQGWSHYRDEKRNPVLPEKLGDPPPV